MDHEIVGTAMAGMLDLADILELIIDRFDQCPFAQEQAIGQRQKDIAHVLAQFGDEAHPVGDQELLDQGLRDVALIAEEATEQPTDQAGHRTAVVGVAGREAEGEQLAAIIDDQVEFEAQNYLTEVLPRRALTRKTRCCWIRAGWHTAREVASIKLMPEHSPSCVCK